MRSKINPIGLVGELANPQWTAPSEKVGEWNSQGIRPYPVWTEDPGDQFSAADSDGYNCTESRGILGK